MTCTALQHGTPPSRSQKPKQDHMICMETLAS